MLALAQPFSVADLSLQPPASFPELYDPLWWNSGSYVTGPSSSYQLIQKGTTSVVGEGNPSSPAGTQTHLVSILATADPNTQYAFEASIQSSSSSYPCSVFLFDATVNTNGSSVSGTTLTTSSTTMQVMRTGMFKLIPGHSYAVGFNNTGASVYITDASLITFPSATQSPYPSLSSVSLANPNGNTLKESKIPLWINSNNNGGLSSGINTSIGGDFLQKGSTSVASAISSATKLITLSSNWPATQKFALEGSFMSGNAAYNAYLGLWDMTSNTAVSGGQVNTTATSSTLVRSGSFMLTPGHSYGISIWSGYTAAGIDWNKIQLVALSS